MQHSIENLIQRCLAGIGSADEEQVVERWRRESADNEGAYEELRSALNSASSVRDAVAVGPAPDARALVWLAEARSSGEQLRGSARGMRPYPWLPLAIAAGLVIGLLVPGVRQVLDHGSPIGVDTFIAGETAPVTVRLTDGSIIRLAPEARLRLLESRRSREVELAGRAYFAISHDSDRAFRIRTKAGEVRVLGTRFQLETANGDVRVIVVDGRVALRGAGEAVEVGTGQMAMLVEGIPARPVDVSDMGSMTDWVGNFFAFRDTPLRSALDEIGRRHDLRVELADSGLAKQTITMWFTDRSVVEMLRVICTVVDAACEVDSNRILVRPN